MFIRGLAIVAGCAILVATAHVIIEHTGGYGSDNAVLTMAITGGIMVGALAIGDALARGHRVMAILIGLCLVSAELFGLIGTGERYVAMREERQAPIRMQERNIDKARQKLQDARAALSAAPTTSARLQTALAAEKAVDATVARDAAKKGCASNCRKLLDKQIAKASAEVIAARAEIRQQRRRLANDVEAASAALAALPSPTKAATLADRLGIARWMMDLIIAALGSLAANGLGATLLAYGAHASDRKPKANAETEHASVEKAASTAKNARTNPPAIADEHEHISTFAQACFDHDPGARATFNDMMMAYQTWCFERKSSRLPASRVSELLAELVEHVGLTVEQQDDEPVVLGLVVKPAAHKLIEVA
ncbi:MAG: hypothetical protein AAF709_04815 [Pseudomonadota bacterium]